MTGLLTFEYSSAYGSLAAAYTSGALAAEFGPDQVRVALCSDASEREWGEPLLSEMTVSEALKTRFDTRLLGVVPDGDGPTWALTTSHVNLERQSALLVRALSAVLQARPHRAPVLDAEVCGELPSWMADRPLRAATILVSEDFATTLPMAA